VPRPGIHPAGDHRVLKDTSCILLDVEGTTTSISFVYDVLFPYAREHAAEFLRQHQSSEQVRAILAELRQQRDADEEQGLAPPSSGNDDQDVLQYVYWLMDRDSKTTPLKSLQGLMWEQGYREGRLKSHVFPDVPQAFKRWTQAGKKIAIFSSGSVLAQKQLFAHTESGDLTRYISGYFDTTVGVKREPASYTKIAGELACEPREVMFVSDVVEELDAASRAGMQAVLAVRPGNHEQRENSYPQVRTFEEL